MTDYPDYYAAHPTAFGPKTLAELYQIWEDCEECQDYAGSALATREIARVEDGVVDVKEFNREFDKLAKKIGVRFH